mgnify:FL=1
MQCSSYKKYVIILAGGSGKRMQAEKEKQFLPLGSSIVLLETLKAVHEAVPDGKLIVVLPEGRFDLWRSLCREYCCEIEHELVRGGKERFFSVKEALNSIGERKNGNALIAIHDGVRPFVDKEIFDRCFKAAAESGAAASCTDCTDSVRYENKPLERAKVKLVQTPQCFDLALLQKAYSQAYDPKFTDDASLVENLGVNVTLCEGKRENIKLTSPIDFIIAKCLTDERQNRGIIP